MITEKMYVLKFEGAPAWVTSLKPYDINYTHCPTKAYSWKKKRMAERHQAFLEQNEVNTVVEEYEVTWRKT